MFLEKIKEVKKNSKKRKFAQTYDLTFSIKGLDLKKPENRFSGELILPEGRGKDQKVVVIADTLFTEAKKVADLALNKQDLEAIIKNKKKLKNLANDYDWFFAELSLMSMVAKQLGTILGPKGKVPKPIPPKVSIEPLVLGAKKKVKITLKNNPVIHIPVGTEKMTDEQVAKNADAVYKFVLEKIPKGKNSIKAVYLKLTMGKPVRI